MKRARIFLFSVVLSLLLVTQVRAAGLIIDPTGTICNPPGSTTNCQKTYTLDDFFNEFVLLSQWGLRIIMFLALIMFVWAGLKFITAGGRSSVIEDGKKIIGGTITGLLISLLAFVIVNTVIMAVTGTSVTVSGVFGKIATVFSSAPNEPAKNINGTPLVRPFSGTGISATDGSCHTASTNWVNTCSTPQVNCSDENSDSGPIRDWQTALLNKGCTCLTNNAADTTKGVDGCFGPMTAQCVRHFQVANGLPLTGEVDSLTQAYLLSSAAKNCDFPTSNPVISALPTLNTAPTPNLPMSGTGCCLVATNQSSSYCVDNVSENTCDTLSQTGSAYAANQPCGASSTFNHACGFCSTTSGSAFQYATENWCKNVAGTVSGNTLQHNLTFSPGTCTGLVGSNITTCNTTLLLTPAP